MIRNNLIYFDDRWSGNHGIGRFATEIKRHIPSLINLPIFGPKLSIYDPIASSLALASCKSGRFFSPGFNPPLWSAIPTAFTIHDLIHLKIAEESSSLRRLYYDTIVRPAIKRGATVLTVSEHSRQDILEWAGVHDDRVRLVGCGVSPIFTHVGKTKGHLPYFLHVGRRAGHKNIGRLLQAFLQVATRTGVRLAFTGTPDRETIANATALGIQDKIWFSGHLSDEGLVGLYQNAIAVVFPSLYEGFGLPIVEAMACGTPVITSRVASMLEVAGPDNAMFVDPYSIEDISHAIDRLLHDTALQRMYSSAGVLRAQQFRWEKVANEVYSVLNNL